MNTIFAPLFISEGHQQRFLAAVQTQRKVYQGKIDPEYGAALYLLTDDEATWELARRYVDRDGIGIQDLLDEQHWSSGYRVLIQLAGNLFNGHIQVDPVELMRLDEHNFLLAIWAIAIRRYGLLLSAVQQAEEEKQ